MTAKLGGRLSAPSINSSESLEPEYNKLDKEKKSVVHLYANNCIFYCPQASAIEERVNVKH